MEPRQQTVNALQIGSGPRFISAAHQMTRVEHKQACTGQFHLGIGPIYILTVPFISQTLFLFPVAEWSERFVI